jgi:hypothetical protein
MRIIWAISFDFGGAIAGVSALKLEGRGLAFLAAVMLTSAIWPHVIKFVHNLTQQK